MKTIEVTEAYYAPIKEKLFITSVINDKLKTIQLNEYSLNLDFILIIFQCFPKDFKSIKPQEYKRLRRKTKTLELYLILDYERIMQGTDEENLNHIKEVFLKGCETFLKPLKGFKWEEFETKINEIL